MDNESNQIPSESPQNVTPPQKKTFSVKILLLTAFIFLFFSSIVYGAYLLGKSKNNTTSQTISPGNSVKNNNYLTPTPLPSPTLTFADKRYSGTILFAQVTHEEEYGTEKDFFNSFLEIYSIDPINFSSLLLEKIKIPYPNAEFSSGPYNAYGTNEPLQWSDDGKIAIFRIEKKPGPGQGAPYFISFYSFDPQTKKIELIYTTENTVSQWLLSPDGKNIYFFEGNKKLGENQNNLLYYLVQIDTLNKSKTTLSSEITYHNYYSDALLWAPDYQSFKWTTQDKETKNYYLYSFNLATRKINKEELKSADTTYGPISWNLSPSQKKYASHEFFGKEIFIYHLDSKIMEKIPVGVEINNSTIWWGDEDKYVLISTRKKSSSISELRVVNLADKSNKVIIDNEENIQPGPFPYKLTKYGYLIEYNRKLYLYAQEKITEISGINISELTAGIKDF